MPHARDSCASHHAVQLTRIRPRLPAGCPDRLLSRWTYRWHTLGIALAGGRQLFLLRLVESAIRSAARRFHPRQLRNCPTHPAPDMRRTHWRRAPVAGHRYRGESRALGLVQIRDRGVNDYVPTLLA